MLPIEFKDRMLSLMGDEAYKLFDEIENVEAIKAFRVNGVKCNTKMLEAAGASVDRDDSLWIQNAFYTGEKFPGSLPEHHSGAIYMQDPSAMATVTALADIEGLKVLDSCAAPGGKTGQLAAAVGHGGVVFANEYESSRARILQSNIERMGCTNVIITNADTVKYREAYKDYFDVVLCDAPCSGEGMFRKNERAIEEWSLENVKMCAERQREILANVIPCIKEGGRLLYSTCTFSLEENEMNVAWILDNYPDFELADVPDNLKDATSEGVCFEGCEYDMKKTRRFYPHVSRGEGQFIALLERKKVAPGECSESGFRDTISCECGSKKAKKISKNGKKENTKLQNKQNVELLELGKTFLKENFTSVPEGDFVVLGDKLWLAPHAELPAFNVVTAGVCLGEGQKGRFVPHHQMFSAFGGLFKRRLCLSLDSTLTRAYLFGEELDIGGLTRVEDAPKGCIENDDGGKSFCSDSYITPAREQNGWAAVMLGGCAAGGVKISGNAAKNHYPKGLRNKRMN